jgi:hypothetical protein
MTSSPVLILGGAGKTGRRFATAQPTLGQASHDFSDDARTVAAANLVRAGS